MKRVRIARQIGLSKQAASVPLGLYLVLAIATSLGIQSIASAHNHDCQDYTITTGFGDGIKVQHGLFGVGKQTVIQDRLGDRYVNEHGILSETQGVQMLGNKYVKHKGLIGGTQMQASDMFGDSIQSRKTFLGLGRKQTNVNLSGVTGMAQNLLGSRFAQRTSLVDQSAFPNPTTPDASNTKPATASNPTAASPIAASNPTAPASPTADATVDPAAGQN